MENLFNLFSYFVLVSVTAERFTEIIKQSIILPIYIKPNGVIYQIISGLFGGYLAFYMPPDFLKDVNHYIVAVVVGLAASGGSGAWNSVLDLLKNYADAVNNFKEK